MPRLVRFGQPSVSPASGNAQLNSPNYEDDNFEAYT